jgi:hypothetical protein
MMAKKVEKSGERDMAFALSTLFQALIVQLMDVKVLTVEQADQVFDGAVKRAKKAADAPDAVRLIQQVHDAMDWDAFYRLSAARRRKKR